MSFSTQDTDASDRGCLRGRRVLIVEDEAMLATALEDALRGAGADVVGPFATLGAAMEAARSEDIDGAVLDIDLAGLDVFPAADILRQRGIPFVFQTGHGPGEDLGAHYPRAPVCRKPVPRAILVGALGALL